jgi:diadenosine tetraphosphatase ApaH/serine/threonine PP2A family protein phosphatase
MPPAPSAAVPARAAARARRSCGRSPAPVLRRRRTRLSYPRPSVTPQEPATPPIAILSDIHGNRQALDAVLRAAREAGARSWWCVGDLVGYGADPVHCLARAIGEAERCIAGNHDLGVTGEVALDLFAGPARAGVVWTREHLGRLGRMKLARLRPEDGDGDVAMFHGSPRDPVWEYILGPEQALAALRASPAALTLVGHTHIPAAWALTPEGAIEGPDLPEGGLLELTGRRWLVNPGSVGQPRDHDARAAWALYEPEAGTITFRRTPYDVAGAQGAILDAGLPSLLAHRLAEGR